MDNSGDVVQSRPAARGGQPHLTRPRSVPRDQRSVDDTDARDAVPTGRIRSDRCGKTRTARITSRPRQCGRQPLLGERDPRRAPRARLHRLLRVAHVANGDHPMGDRRTVRTRRTLAFTRRVLRVRTPRKSDRRRPEQMVRDHRSGSLRRTGPSSRGPAVREFRATTRPLLRTRLGRRSDWDRPRRRRR